MLGRVGQHAAVHALADAIQNLGGGAHADIGADEGEFQFIEQIGIDLAGALKHVFELGDQTGAGLFDAAFQLFEQCRLLLDRAE